MDAKDKAAAGELLRWLFLSNLKPIFEINPRMG